METRQCPNDPDHETTWNVTVEEAHGRSYVSVELYCRDERCNVLFLDSDDIQELLGALQMEVVAEFAREHA